jgi:hypothetical protein
MNKEERLLEYLEKNPGITSLDAIYELGDTRLSATIFNLRNSGYNIQDIWKQEKNRYGKDTRFKFYHLVK